VRYIRIDLAQITDWPSFHDVFAAAFGFPGFYGRNMNAWIDGMTRLDEAFNDVRVEPGELVTLELDGMKALKQRCPEQYDALVECAAFVNWRRRESGGLPILVMSFYT
jgi:RNAse (barnase) inhibitor barstar